MVRHFPLHNGKVLSWGMAPSRETTAEAARDGELGNIRLGSMWSPTSDRGGPLGWNRMGRPKGGTSTNGAHQRGPLRASAQPQSTRPPHVLPSSPTGGRAQVDLRCRGLHHSIGEFRNPVLLLQPFRQRTPGPPKDLEVEETVVTNVPQNASIAFSGESSPR